MSPKEGSLGEGNTRQSWVELGEGFRDITSASLCRQGLGHLPRVLSPGPWNRAPEKPPLLMGDPWTSSLSCSPPLEL